MAGDLTVNNLTCATVNSKSMSGHVLENGLGGSSQTWQDVTASRALGVTYTNTTGKPIIVFVSMQQISTNQNTIIGINNVTIHSGGGQIGISGAVPHTFIVPNMGTYIITSSNSITRWSELR